MTAAVFSATLAYAYVRNVLPNVPTYPYVSVLPYAYVLHTYSRNFTSTYYSGQTYTRRLGPATSV